MFLINVPVVVLALAAGAALLPESRDPHAPSIDRLSVGLSVSGLGLFVYGLIQAPTDGWSDPVVLTTIGVGLAGIASFVARNLRRRRPLVDLTLFRDRTFTWGTGATVFASLAMMGSLFVLPLYLQAVNGFTALQTGVRLVPLILGIAVAGRFAPRLSARLGYRTVIATGLVVLAGGFVLATLTTVDSPYAYAAVWLGVVGLGLGATMVPAMDAVLATLPEAKAGAGSGLVQTMRQVAGVLGVAGLGSLLNGVYSGQLPGGAPAAARESIVAAIGLGDPVLTVAAKHAFVTGMDAVLAAGAVGALVGAILVAVFLRRPAGMEQPTPAGGTEQPARTAGMERPAPADGMEESDHELAGAA